MKYKRVHILFGQLRQVFSDMFLPEPEVTQHGIRSFLRYAYEDLTTILIVVSADGIAVRHHRVYDPRHLLV